MGSLMLALRSAARDRDGGCDRMAHFHVIGRHREELAPYFPSAGGATREVQQEIVAIALAFGGKPRRRASVPEQGQQRAPLAKTGPLAAAASPPPGS